MRLRLALIATLLATSGLASAEPRPSLDDFYQRTRSRTEGFDRCLGYCDGETLAAFLVGAQVADPSTDAVQRALAYGGRLGVDLGAFGGRYDVARTKLWVDVLRVEETDDVITDLAWQTTLFRTWGEPGDLGMHLSLDTLLAQKTELEPSDFAEFRLEPYRMTDVEVEVAPTADKIDKDAFLALPLGAASLTRWDEDGERIEARRTGSAALAFRGFLRNVRHHYQLDALRVKRTSWTTRAGDAGAWTLSAGYQRLSPDVEWLELWLLAGWGWHHGANEQSGFIAQLGAEMTFEGDYGRVELGPMYEAHFALDTRDNRFSRVHEVRLYYRHGFDVLLFGVSYQGVALSDVATLHAFTPEAGLRLFGVELTARYRISLVEDNRFAGAPAEDRFNVSADWLF